ncbi:HCL094Wp [Eremothecium sinecaudum]|uniref:HCL094Wp n=1 Tax=Eremothecium sinecaudum TaxID=45286 RepID=A0A120K208_9SACH|nr:HCL094Wp [Eremothecium sinecaudum]AMD20057.1 HCL094Wp [Eremothecium sinecaudum]
MSDILYHFKSAVRIGELERYIIIYDLYNNSEAPSNIQLNSLWLKVKNTSNLTYRAAYLMGPYILYCDVRSGEYHHSQKLYSSADIPQFDSTIQAQQEFIAELSIHTLKKRYVWIVDVVSQIIFTATTQVGFEITIATSKDIVMGDIESEPWAGSFSENLTVNRLTALDLWNLPQQIFDDFSKPIHLVVLTHGLHSNVGADLHYLKEQVEKCQKYYPNEILVVKGYTENVCKTEKGIKYLGMRLGDYVTNTIYNPRTRKISFIGHSLGGLVQTFAIAHIAVKYPWFFENVEPVNFITLASPLLGIVTNNPVYVNMFLSMGIVGKTGQDLRMQVHSGDKVPVLYALPGAVTRGILKRFKKRTVYANATNDGIVPLYSSCLLYLDHNDIKTKLKNTVEFQADKQDLLTKTFVNPLAKAINLFAPQTHGDSAIPKLSVIDSVMSIILPPLPDKKYLMDPSSKSDVILHDRIYTEKDIPAPTDPDLEQVTNWDSMSLNFSNNEQYKHIEEELAKKWHQGLTWRKVIVNLQPDAHNNIIVRRRFINAYGWPVIDHLVQNHFNGSDGAYTDDVQEELRSHDTEEEERLWISRQHEETFFDVGPTGMISSVGEFFENIRNTAFQRNARSSSTNSNGSIQDDIFRIQNDLW